MQEKAEENAQLDAEEMLHLAIDCSRRQDHKAAIEYLKQSIAKSESANAYFMLAAEHAEIGLYDRAVAGMCKAVEMDPELWTAHLQHGLLHVRLNQPDAAIAAWQPLDALDGDHYLYLFKQGLTELMQNNLPDAAKLLISGMQANQSNLPLNNDMLRIVNNIRAALEGTESNASEAETETNKASKNEMLLNKYYKDKQ